MRDGKAEILCFYALFSFLSQSRLTLGSRLCCICLRETALVNMRTPEAQGSFDADEMAKSRISGRIPYILVLGLIGLAGRQCSTSEVIIEQRACNNENA